MDKLKKMNKKYTLLITLIIFVAVVAGVYCKSFPAQAEGGQKQAPHIMQVKAVKIAYDDVQLWKSFSGRTKAVDIVDIRPQVAGTITQVNFKDGQQVKKGDLLFVIDPRPYKAQVKKLEADLKAAKNQEENAQRNLYRAKELRKTSTVSQSNFEDRETAYTVAVANREATEANLDNAKVSLDYAYVKSPIDGKVNRAELTVGNLVVAGGNTLTTVVSDKEMYVDFEVDEQTYLKSIRDSIKKHELNVPVHVSSVGDSKKYKGVVSSFDNQIDISSGTIRARAVFENEDKALISGMFVTVEMGTPVMKNQILISEKAIGTNQDRKYVYVINKDSKIEYRDVVLGELVDGKRIVKSGLNIDDVVVVDGLIKIRPGMPVEPKFAE